MTRETGSAPAGAELPISRRGASVESDMAQLAATVRERGAARARVLNTRDLVLDPEGALTAHDEPCRCGQGNLMVPPFSPPPAESARWLQAFTSGIAFQFERRVGATYAGLVQGQAGWACQLSAARARADFATDVLPLWRELHDSVMWAERECMRRGYYLSVGLGAGACELCPACDPSKLCVLPYQARPSLEAVGIDISRTLPRLQWPAGGPTEGGWNLALTGIVLAA